MQPKDFHVNVLVLDKLPSMPPFGWIRSSFLAQIPCDATASTAICFLLEAPIASLSVELSQHAGGMALSWPRAPVLHGNSNGRLTLGLASGFNVCTCVSPSCHGNATMFVTNVCHCQKCNYAGPDGSGKAHNSHNSKHLRHTVNAPESGVSDCLWDLFSVVFFSLFTSPTFRLHCYKSSDWGVLRSENLQISCRETTLAYCFERKHLFQATCSDRSWLDFVHSRSSCSLVFANVPLSLSIHPKMATKPSGPESYMGPMRAWQSAFSVWFSSLVRKGLPQGCLTSRIRMHTSAGKQTSRMLRSVLLEPVMFLYGYCSLYDVQNGGILQPFLTMHGD